LPTEETVHEEKDNTEEVQGTVAVEVRSALAHDAARMWELARNCDTLDTNSCYAYLLMCRDFSATTVVALVDAQLVGFVTAYVPPERRDVLFVWQVAVQAEMRQQGIAKKLLLELLTRAVRQGVRALEATVTPSNLGSRRLFASLAKERRAKLTFQEGFSADDFGSAQHEAEETLRMEFNGS
jgi:L-2,4-diaminobutyric acid acetyltransferase